MRRLMFSRLLPGVTTAYTVQAILIIRIHGMYGSRKLAYALWSLLVICFGVELYLAIKYVPGLVELDLGPVIGNFCVAVNLPNVDLIW